MPTVLILGRTNAGKSTFFNRLVGGRRNIVLDEPGVTRDFLEAAVRSGPIAFRLIDTAGFEPQGQWSYPEVQTGIRTIIDEADLIVYLVDGTEDVNPIDRDVIRDLNRRKPLLVVVHKIDSDRREANAQHFYELGTNALYFASSAHNRGIHDVLDAIQERLKPKHGPKQAKDSGEPEAPTEETTALRGRKRARKALDPFETAEPTEQVEQNEQEEMTRDIKVAIVGRPNVGKSTLLNMLCGKTRAIASPRPGTTRDAILAEITHEGRTYLFVDTAGIRRPGRRDGDVERLSIAQSMRGIEQADVILWLVDADAGFADQDRKVLGAILQEKKPFAAVLNKWDAVLAKGKTIRAAELEKKWRKQFLVECPFATYASVLFVSALRGTGRSSLFKHIDMLYRESRHRLATHEVNARLEPIVSANPPPPRGSRPTRIYYASQVGIAPPTFVFFTNHPTQVKTAYTRFLEAAVRREFSLHHIPVSIVIRGKNRSYSTSEQ